jgi:hypothetical protein
MMIQVHELSLHLVEFGLMLLVRDVMTNKNLLIVQQHAIDGLDRIFSSLGGLVVNKSVASGPVVFISRDFARKLKSEEILEIHPPVIELP